MVQTSDFQGEFEITEHDLLLHNLARKYHEETEAFDRTVCTGTIRDGGIVPMNAWQFNQVLQNAAKVRKRIVQEGASAGVTPSEIRRAIARFNP